MLTNFTYICILSDKTDHNNCKSQKKNYALRTTAICELTHLHKL